MKNNTSDLNILISLETDALQQLLNERLPDPLIKDLEPPDAMGIVINARKNGKITIEATGNTFEYQVPLQIHAYKPMILGDVDVKFEMMVGLKTNFVIKDDWQLVTRTEFVGYQWIKKPKLNLGFFSVPLDATIVDAIYNNKETICKLIDEQVMTQMDVRSPLSNLLVQLPNPMVFMETEKIWWHCDAIKTSLAPLSTDEGWVYITMGLQAPLYFSYGKKIDIAQTVLNAPDIALELDKKSTIRTSCYVDFKTVEKFATTFLQQKEFDIKGQKIKVQKVQVNGSNGKLNIVVEVEGSFNGTVNVAAQPIFNSSKKQIELKDPELDLQGKGFRSKAIALVAEKAIEAKMSEFLNFPIQKGIDLLNQKIEATNVPPNLVVRGKVKNVEIPEIEITAEGLNLGIIADGLILLKTEGNQSTSGFV